MAPKKTMTNHANSQIELQHILIEIENNRGQHLRHFVDQWYCYTQNLTTSNGNAKWDLILDQPPAKQPNPYPASQNLKYPVTHYSDKAAAFFKKGTEWWKGGFVKEHTIPLRVVTEILLSLKKHWGTLPQKQKIDDIETALEQLVVFSAISSDEDKLLSAKKLKQKMPLNWTKNIQPDLENNRPNSWKTLSSWNSFDQFSRYRNLIAPW